MHNIYRKLLAALCCIGLGWPAQMLAVAFESSTADAPKWFRLFTPNRENRTLTSAGTATYLSGAASFTYTDDQLWRVELRTDGTYNLVCRSGGVYIDPSRTQVIGINPAFYPVSTEPQTGWQIKAISGQNDLYIIVSGTKQLHQGGTGDQYRVISYGGGSNTSDPGCQFRFESFDPTDPMAVPRKEAENYLEVLTSEGTNPGQYTAEARQTYREAIAAATTTAELNEARQAYDATRLPVVAGTTYYIVSGPSAAYCQGQVIYSPGQGTQPKFGARQASASYVWTFEDAGNQKFYIRNVATGEYLNAPNATTAQPQTAYAVTSLGQQAAFTIQSAGQNPVHAQQNGSVIVTWAGGLNTASAWQFEALSDDDLNTPVSIQSANAVQGFLTMAPGNTDRIVMRADLQVGGFQGSTSVSGMTIDLSGSTDAAADLACIKVYRSTSNLFYGTLKAQATLLDSVTVSGNTVQLQFSEPQKLEAGSTCFFITADLKPTATPDHEIDATLKSIQQPDGELDINSNPTGKARIFKSHTMLFNPYDDGSHYWRIPAMLVLRHQKDDALNGRIVTVTDKRYNSNGDLPNYIDLITRHSDDNGLTWSEGKLIAGDPAVSPNYGYGDAALVETAHGRIICLMVADKQFQGSSYSSPIRYYMTYSDDGGQTWSKPEDLTSQLYAHQYVQGQLQGGFTTSGRGILLQHQQDASRNGRVMFAMVCKFSSGNYQNYTLYSDDEGLTWNVSATSAYDGGDEAKVAELPDGTVMLSTRRSGNRGFNLSTDGGETWGQQYENSQIWGASCNADILVYSDDIILHTICNSGSRQNVTLYASIDGGKTYPYKKVICELGSAYSTIERLANGDVAVYYEDNSMGDDAYSMNFVTLPISWLVSGNPGLENFKNLVNQARQMAEADTYDEAQISTAKAGEYEQNAIEALRKVIPTDEQIEQMSSYTEATRAIEAAMEAARATCITVDGYSPDTYFTISSLENIGDADAPFFISGDGKAYAESNTLAQKWLIRAAETQGRVTLQNADNQRYLYRSGNTVALQEQPAEWGLEKSGSNYLLHAYTGNNGYVVINKGTGALDFWNSASGNDTWRTTFVLTASGAIEDGISQTLLPDGIRISHKAIYADGPARAYNLSGQRVPLGQSLPTGTYIIQSGQKTCRVLIQ